MGRHIIDCPRCHGEGEEPPNLFLAIVTLGVSHLIERSCPRVACARCQGRGWVYRRPRHA